MKNDLERSGETCIKQSNSIWLFLTAVVFYQQLVFGRQVSGAHSTEELECLNPETSGELMGNGFLHQAKVHQMCVLSYVSEGN